MSSLRPRVMQRRLAANVGLWAGPKNPASALTYGIEAAASYFQEQPQALPCPLISVCKPFIKSFFPLLLTYDPVSSPRL
jgi:hypothetical protein